VAGCRGALAIPSGGSTVLTETEVGEDLATELLKPYVPRLVLEWAGESPDTRHRAIDGSLVFVDISGFTKMCERLARKGKIGAEEVNDVLDLCFTHLLSIAYEFDGGVLKWGGDAVLLLFSGDGHAARAARAAHGMRAALRRFRHFQTTAGAVSLRMSVGIHSGAVDLFLVGGTHRELLVTGPAATRTVAMESAATAGEILLSPETAALLPPGNVGRWKEPGYLLRSEPDAPVVRARPAAVPPGVDVREFVPVAIHEHLVAGGGDMEHRRVAVAFVRFEGIDELLTSRGAEAAADALDRLIRVVQDAAIEHGVSFHETDIDRDGGKVLLVAGAPQSTGHDEERLLRTVRAVVDAEQPLGLRVGVNAGYVFAGDFGPPYRRSYSIKGDAVNLAARVMGRAERGSILATEGVLGRSRTMFETIALEPFTVKGKRHPVQAFAVGPAMGAREEPGREALPLIGRDREVAAIRAGLDAIDAGTGRVIEFVGEPGIGKSRLIDELRLLAETRWAVSASCDPYESSTAYHAVRAVLRWILGIPVDAEPAAAAESLADRVREAAPHLLRWLPLIGIPMDVVTGSTPEVDRLDVEFRKPRLEEAVSELVAAVLTDPTVLVFEDVHWMDEASADLLRRLLAMVDARPWLVCLSRRDDEGGFAAPESPATVTFVLSPLESTDAAALAVAASEAHPLSPHQVAQLTERAGGNPLFLQELVLAARTSGLEGLPGTIEELLAERIDRLGAADRALLRHASVLGARFDRSMLEAALGDQAAAVGEPDVWERLADYLVREPGGSFSYRHALIRDAAYEGLPYRRRREIHARVGEKMELTAPDPVDESELLSLHFFHAQRFDKAWRYSRLAAERAREKFANVEAAGFYRRAIEAARHLPGTDAADLAGAFVSLGDVSDRGGLYGDAAAAYRSARRLVAGDPMAEARLLLKEGIIRDRSGRYAQAMTWYRRGLRALEGANGDSPAAAVRAQLSVWYAAARRQQGRLREAIAWSLDAIREAEAGGDRDALAHAYRLLDWIYTEMGDPRAAEARERALSLYEELGDLAGIADVLNQLGMDAYFEGDWAASVAYYERSLEAAERIGDVVTTAVAINNIAEIRSDQGRLEEAEAMFREARRIWEATRFSIGVPSVIANLGRFAARAGRHDEAETLLHQAVSRFREVGAERGAIETEARIAENRLLAGRPDEALDLAIEAQRKAEDQGGLGVIRAMLERIRGEALTALGRGDEASGHLDRSLALARSVGADYEVAQTLLAQARLARALTSPDVDGPDAEAAGILERLGVIRLPEALIPASG
jgi:class 3 adenylate cyclase/tetratricopeptide (TPR) repeat protein